MHINNNSTLWIVECVNIILSVFVYLFNLGLLGHLWLLDRRDLVSAAATCLLVKRCRVCNPMEKNMNRETKNLAIVLEYMLYATKKDTLESLHRNYNFEF